MTVQKGFFRKIVIIKTCNQADLSEKVFMLQRLQHEHFNPLLNISNFKKVIYIVFDHMLITLTQMIEYPAYLDKVQLAGILRQVKKLS